MNQVALRSVAGFIGSPLRTLESVFLLLGANLGDRVATLHRAGTLLSERIGAVVHQSNLYETAPWGITDQPAFLNQVVWLNTELAPNVVLDQTQAIEQELGRIRTKKWGARTIDIDVLFIDQQIIRTERLTVPHPYLHERRFTLVPLAEIAPDFVHPVLKKTIRQLLAECADMGEVTAYDKSTGSN